MGARHAGRGCSEVGAIRVASIHPKLGWHLDVNRYWRNFAWTGDPNNGTGADFLQGSDGTGPVWPAYAKASDSYLVLGDAGANVNTSASPLYYNVTTVSSLKARRCDWWDGYHADAQA